MKIETLAKIHAERGASPIATALPSLFAAIVAGGAPLIAAHAAPDDALEEVVVTAQRRAETVQDVPIAITAFSGEDLAERGVRTASEIAVDVPNMTLSTPFGPEGMPVFAIRGVSESDYTQHQSSPIAMYVDEVYKSIGAVQAQQTYDLDRVEVLRGPQGTLYGKNATGGAVSFYTKDPSLSAYEGYVTAGTGNYYDRSVRAAVGGPIIGDELGWRAALYYEKRDGWEKSIIPGVQPLEGVDVLAGRLTFLWKLADSVTAKLKLSTSDAKGTPYGTRPFDTSFAITGFSGSLPWFETADKWSYPERLRNDNVSLKLDWAMDDHYTLTSVTGFDYGYWYIISDDQGLGYNDAGVPIHIADPDSYLSSINAFSEELRIASRDLGMFEWLGGLYYGRDNTHLTQQYEFFDSFPGSFVTPSGTTLYGFNQYNNFNQIRDTRAIFLNATAAVTPAVTFRAGVRYTKDVITINHFYALQGGLESAPVGLGPNDGVPLWTQTIPIIPSTFVDFVPGLQAQSATYPSLSQSNDNVSGEIGVDWRPLDGLLAYAKISQGYRGAAFNGQAYSPPADLTFAKPEILRSYEIGIKSEFWDRRAIINAAFYYYDYRDMQFLNIFGLPNNEGFGEDISNAPRTKNAGAEIEMRVKPVTDLVISAGLGLQDARFVSLTLFGVNLDGNHVFQSPNVSANAAVDWSFAHLSEGTLRLHVDGNFYSSQYWDPYNYRSVEQPAYALANGRLSFESLKKPGFGVGVWVKNITDKEYNTYELAELTAAQGGFGENQALAGEPRTYGLDLTYKF